MAEFEANKSDKTKLRRSLLQKRQNLSPQEWQHQSQQIAACLQANPLFAQAKTVLAYFSTRQEADLGYLFAQSHCQWGFPRLQGKSMVWHQWQPGQPLQMGSYGIREPRADAPILEPDAVDLILVPAVACDRLGYRLGYGGGYYDRLLSSPAWAAKPTIGIVFSFAFLAQLPIEEWDKPLTAVCTEAGFFRSAGD